MMRFAPNEDQTAFLSVLDQMLEGPGAAWSAAPDWARFATSPGLDATLTEAGFFDCAREPTLGLTAAAMMTYRVAQVPVLVECAASTLLRATYAPHLPRPFAVIEHGLDEPVHFLPAAGAVMRLDAEDIRVARLKQGHAETVESLFAYPAGRIRAGADLHWETVDGDVQEARNLWRVGLAAELSGCLKGGLDAVVRHVTDRHQFGRPLGSFQTIQHRLAQAAVKIEAAYWLALRAAGRREQQEGALALGYIQEAASRIVLDLHQFMGAMGLTLEHPLHRWTYRARLLRARMGGPSGNLRHLYNKTWTAA